MRGKKELVLPFLTISFLFVVWACAAFAENFPARPIRYIIPFDAGGTNDVLIRSLQKSFEKELGNKIVIENIPGGSTKVGTLTLMNAKPDGYTIMSLADNSWVTLYYGGIYDIKVWEKLTPIGTMASEPFSLMEVRVESPYKTWGDVVKAAKETPGKLTCGGPGGGGVTEIFFNEICKASGIEIKYVPFVGAGAARTALLGGHIDLRACQPGEAIVMIRAGKTKGLALLTDKRLEQLPDVPTFKELGIGVPVIALQRSVWAPPKVSKGNVSIISKALERAMRDPDFINIVESQLILKANYKDPEATQKTIVNFDKEFGPKFASARK